MKQPEADAEQCNCLEGFQDRYKIYVNWVLKKEDEAMVLNRE